MYESENLIKFVAAAVSSFIDGRLASPDADCGWRMMAETIDESSGRGASDGIETKRIGSAKCSGEGEANEVHTTI